jgi:hypothetical protein
VSRTISDRIFAFCPHCEERHDTDGSRNQRHCPSAISVGIAVIVDSDVIATSAIETWKPRRSVQPGWSARNVKASRSRWR